MYVHVHAHIHIRVHVNAHIHIIWGCPGYHRPESLPEVRNTSHYGLCTKSNRHSLIAIQWNKINNCYSEYACACVYVCNCLCLFVCVSVCVWCVCTHLYLYVYACMYKHDWLVPTKPSLYVYVYVHVYVYVYVCVCVCVCVCVTMLPYTLAPRPLIKLQMEFSPIIRSLSTSETFQSGIQTWNTNTASSMLPRWTNRNPNRNGQIRKKKAILCCGHTSFVLLKKLKKIQTFWKCDHLCPSHTSQHVTNGHKFGVTGTKFSKPLFRFLFESGSERLSRTLQRNKKRIWVAPRSCWCVYTCVCSCY